jgi:hypothetical protein
VSTHGTLSKIVQLVPYHDHLVALHEDGSISVVDINRYGPEPITFRLIWARR